MITSLVRSARSLFASGLLCMVLVPAVQAQSQSYAPVIFWNVPNYYSGDWERIRYPDPTSAFTVEWDVKSTQQCGKPILFGYREVFLNVFPVDPQGYPIGSFYNANVQSYWCTGEVRSSYEWGSTARRWAGCTNEGPWHYSPAGLTCTVASDKADPQQNNGEPKCPDCGYGEPISASVGNKYELKQEYVGNGVFPLMVAWAYNSSGDALAASEAEKSFGRNRIGHYSRSVRSYSNCMS